MCAAEKAGLRSLRCFLCSAPVAASKPGPKSMRFMLSRRVQSVSHRSQAQGRPMLCVYADVHVRYMTSVIAVLVFDEDRVKGLGVVHVQPFVLRECIHVSA